MNISRLSTIGRLGLAALVAVGLSGCLGGGEGGGVTIGGITFGGTTGTVSTSADAIKLGNLTAAQWKEISLQGSVSSVTIPANGKPVVNFTVTSGGKPVVGLTTSQVAFTIAKLVPSVNGTPSTWVNYIVANPVPTEANPFAGTLGKPNVEATGTLLDNADGSYTYTFSRMITGTADTAGSVQGVLAHFTDSGNNKAADLGDVSWQPSLTHRVAVQIQGYNNVAATDRQRLDSAVNLFYDFKPATGAKVAADDAGNRELVNINNCNQCHQHLAFHGGGSRVDTQICVLCHTDQRKYGYANATIDYATQTLKGPDGLVWNAAAPVTASRTDRVLDKSWTDFPTMVHKVHNGHNSRLTGNNIHGLDVAEITFPQSQTNCVACHNNAAQATKIYDNTSRKACGSCHDGIDWATGTGVALNGATTGHQGGGFADDANCNLCHRAGGLRDNKLAHAITPNNFVLNNAIDTAGAYKLTYDLSSFTFDGTTASVTIAIKKDGTNIDFGEYNATTKPYLYMQDATRYATFFPSREVQVVLAWGALKDGIMPADYTNNMSIKLIGTSGIWQAPTVHVAGSNTWTRTSGTVTWTMTKNVDNTYTLSTPVALTGVKTATAILYGTWNQYGLTRWAANVSPVTIAPQTATKPLTGAARRVIVSADKCNACHGQLGALPNFHGGMRNDPQICGVCHNADLTAGHGSLANQLDAAHPTQSADSTVFVHRIHSGKTVFAEDTGFEITYPQSMSNCARCHEGNAITTMTDNRLFRRTSHTQGSPSEDKWTVSSPTAAACSSCHDSDAAAGHMASASGVVGKFGVNQAEITALTASTRESCMTCHGPGRDSDIMVKHAQ